jgi:hypothetical protein
MRTVRNALFAILLTGLTSTGLATTDQEDATKAAAEILTSIHEQKFEKLWTTQTSEWYKSKVTKESFIANLTLGRQPLGLPQDIKFIDMAYAKMDASTGYQGDIYAFNYLTTYAVGKFYERVVVIKEKDGAFRLSGLWGAPAPK